MNCYCTIIVLFYDEEILCMLCSYGIFWTFFPHFRMFYIFIRNIISLPLVFSFFFLGICVLACLHAPTFSRLVQQILFCKYLIWIYKFYFIIIFLLFFFKCACKRAFQVKNSMQTKTDDNAYIHTYIYKWSEKNSHSFVQLLLLQFLCFDQNYLKYLCFHFSVCMSFLYNREGEREKERGNKKNVVFFILNKNCELYRLLEIRCLLTFPL